MRGKIGSRGRRCVTTGGTRRTGNSGRLPQRQQRAARLTSSTYGSTERTEVSAAADIDAMRNHQYMNKLGEQREVGGTPWAARDMSRSGSQLGSSRALALQRACMCASDETRLFRHFTACLTDQRFAILTRRDSSFIGPLSRLWDRGCGPMGCGRKYTLLSGTS